MLCCRLYFLEGRSIPNQPCTTNGSGDQCPIDHNYQFRRTQRCLAPAHTFWEVDPLPNQPCTATGRGDQDAFEPVILFWTVGPLPIGPIDRATAKWKLEPFARQPQSPVQVKPNYVTNHTTFKTLSIDGGHWSLTTTTSRGKDTEISYCHYRCIGR